MVGQLCEASGDQNHTAALHAHAARLCQQDHRYGHVGVGQGQLVSRDLPVTHRPHLQVHLTFPPHGAFSRPLPGLKCLLSHGGSAHGGRGDDAFRRVGGDPLTIAGHVTLWKDLRMDTICLCITQS